MVSISAFGPEGRRFESTKGYTPDQNICARLGGLMYPVIQVYGRPNFCVRTQLTIQSTRGGAQMHSRMRGGSREIVGVWYMILPREAGHGACLPFRIAGFMDHSKLCLNSG